MSVETAPSLRALDDSFSGVRCAAAEAMGERRYRKSARVLVKLAREDRDWLVRVCAAEALGDLGCRFDTVAMALMSAVEGDSGPLVRAYAAEALGRLGIAKARRAIRARLKAEPLGSSAP